MAAGAASRCTLAAMAGTAYPIRIGRKSAPFLRVLFGVTSDRAWAAIRDGDLIARFGWWEFHVPVANIVRWRIEGPWRWITAIGVRRSIRHGDLSFAGSPRGGVRLDFAAPVRWGILTVPALYVGVDDLEGFAAELAARGIPGEDARTT
jgi:hypothetical protein